MQKYIHSKFFNNINDAVEYIDKLPKLDEGEILHINCKQNNCICKCVVTNGKLKRILIKPYVTVQNKLIKLDMRMCKLYNINMDTKIFLYPYYNL